MVVQLYASRPHRSMHRLQRPSEFKGPRIPKSAFNYEIACCDGQSRCASGAPWFSGPDHSFLPQMIVSWMASAEITMHSNRVLAAVLISSIAVGPCNSVEAQIPQVLVRAGPLVARAIPTIRAFLVEYLAGKGIDELIEDGSAVRDSLQSLRDQLNLQARREASDRAILLRQAAVLESLRSDLQLLLSRRPSLTEATSIERRTSEALSAIRAIQFDHERRLGQLELGQDSLRLLLDSFTAQLSTGAQEQGQHRNMSETAETPTQTIQYLRTRLLSLQRIGTTTMRVTLEFSNSSGDSRGLALAYKAKGSDEIADYWKFMPQPLASLTDNRGNDFTLRSASGLGFARTQEDWTLLTTGTSTAAVLDFSLSAQPESLTRYSVAIEIRLVWRDQNNNQHQSPFTVLLRDLSESR
jgi:hypothetical protein